MKRRGLYGNMEALKRPEKGGGGLVKMSAKAASSVAKNADTCTRTDIYEIVLVSNIIVINLL